MQREMCGRGEVMTMASTGRLAIEGGSKVRTKPWPKHAVLGEEEKRAVTTLFDHAIRTGDPIGYNGEQERLFCEEFAAFHGGGFADAVNSGSSAIWVALRALEIEPFGEVIVAPTSDQGSFMPVALNNCIPVPADSRPGSHATGSEQIAERINDNTRAILLVHLAGYPLDLDPIMELARARSIPVIEDCAQAHGAVYRGRMVGTIGDAGVFSTMFGKHFSTGGQGGVVFTQNEELYWRIRRSADRGKPFGMPEPPPGRRVATIAAHNVNMDELGAAIGREQLRKLPHFLERRRTFAERVASLCESELKAVRVEPVLPDCAGAFWKLFFTLDIDQLSVDRNVFLRALEAEGFPVDSYYYPITAFSWFQEQKVFGTSGYPWRAPAYKGDPDRQFPLPNLVDADLRQFRLHMNHCCGDQEAADLVEALGKLEAAYLS